MGRRHQLLIKLAALIVWPALAVLFAALIVVMFLSVWLLIPFGTFTRKQDGNYTLTFPWGD